ncbi:hypothetical protein K501DRAFT_330386 [Backusella circina FSU 941]|nr:hypothetical protein K501DRAFT_330386 [Backusella circina FSU 941]
MKKRKNVFPLLFLPLFSFSLFYSLFYLMVTASKVIECTFPCQNSGDACTITQSTIHCDPITDNKWILKSPSSVPSYQGTLSQTGQTCQTIPLPNLRDATHLSTNTSETVIEWPPNSEDHPVDKYFGNCDDTSFCNQQTSTCVQRYDQGHYCDSTNQCTAGHLCKDSTCEFASSPAHKESRGLTTVHIVVAVLGVLLVIGIAIGVYLIRKKRRKSRAADKDTEQQQKDNINNINSISTNNSHIRTPSTSSSSQPSNHQVTTMLAYEDHFQNTQSPTMQQQTLQYQLQRQLHGESKVSPPPPYSP